MLFFFFFKEMKALVKVVSSTEKVGNFRLPLCLFYHLQKDFLKKSIAISGDNIDGNVKSFESKLRGTITNGLKFMNLFIGDGYVNMECLICL